MDDHRLCEHARRIRPLVCEVFGHGINLARAVFAHEAQQFIAVVQGAFGCGIVKGVISRRKYAVAHLSHKLCH